MEEKQSAMSHMFQFSNRQMGSITGVSDVISFDTNEILLATDSGLMTIKGSELHVKRLSLESHEVDLEGKVDSIVYTEGGIRRGKSGENLMKRLFK